MAAVTGQGYTPIQFADGLFGRAGSFNPSVHGAAVLIKKSPTMSAAGSEMSLACWVRLDGIVGGSSFAMIYEENYDGALEPFYLRINGNSGSPQLELGTFNGGPGVVVVNLPSLGSQLPKWMHIVGTVSAATGLWSLYINGVLAATASVGLPFSGGTGDISLGCAGGSILAGTRYWTGLIDSVLLWRRPLASHEVLRLYHDTYEMFRPRYLWKHKTSTYTLAINAGFYNLTGEAVVEKAARKEVPVTGFYTYTGEAIKLAAARKEVPNAGFYSFTGEAATMQAIRKLALQAGFYNFTGETVAEKVGRALSTNTGFYALTGENATEVKALKTKPATGFYNFIGELVTLATSGTFSITLATGYFALSGLSITEAAARKTVPSTGFYNLTGEIVIDAVGRKTIPATGFYVFTGEVVVEAAQRKEVPQSGFYSFTGEVMTPQRARNLNAFTGFYGFTGEPVTFKWLHAMKLLTGFYSFNGKDAALVHGSSVVIVGQPTLLAYETPINLLGYENPINLTAVGEE